MKSSSVRRSNLSKEGINILKKVVFNTPEDEKIVFKDNKDTGSELEVHNNALSVLYKNVSENKKQTKPLVYFFIGLAVGALSVLFLSAVLLVSEKDSIETDVKSVKENIIENEKTPDATVNTNISVPDISVEEVDENGSRVYVVKEGDTLGGIVNRLYGDSSTYNPEKVEKFKEANGLKSIHVLKIGQKLVIPD